LDHEPGFGQLSVVIGQLSGVVALVDRSSSQLTNDH